MKTTLMLIVGLMLAGCGSMENDVRNHGVASTSRPPLPDPGDTIAVDTNMRLPLTINSGHSQIRASRQRFSSQDRARIADKNWRLVIDPSRVPSTIRARFTAHGAV